MARVTDLLDRQLAPAQLAPAQLENHPLGLFLRAEDVAGHRLERIARPLPHARQHPFPMALGANDDIAAGIGAAAHAIQDTLELATVAAVDAGLELACQVPALRVDLVHGRNFNRFRWGWQSRRASPIYPNKG